MLRSIALGLVVVAGLAAAPQARSTPIVFGATLAGTNENPVNASPGTGIAWVTFDDDANTLRVEVSFSGLLGNVTASHVHCCTAPPTNVGVATALPSFPGFPTGGTSGTYDRTFDTTLASTFSPGFIGTGTVAAAEAAFVNGMTNGLAYLNIHTTMFPGGEIRGFLHVVPEPGTLGLITAGLLGALALRRRKRG